LPISNGASPIASALGIRLGATPRGRIYLNIHPPALPCKADISTWQKSGHFYLALTQVQDVREREIRDLPWSVYRATVVVEVHRVRCPECGVRVEKIEQLPSKAPFSKRFEEVVGQACESATASQVARRFQLPETTVRAIDMRYLERWEQQRRKPKQHEQAAECSDYPRGRGARRHQGTAI